MNMEFDGVRRIWVGRGEGQEEGEEGGNDARGWRSGRNALNVGGRKKWSCGPFGEEKWQ